MAGDLILVSVLQPFQQPLLTSSQITGVSGYIGFKTLILALEAGYRVRAVIRKAKQSTKPQSHSHIAPHVSNLQWVVITDLADTASFDAHLEGVTGILHLASPLAKETDNH